MSEDTEKRAGGVVSQGGYIGSEDRGEELVLLPPGSQVFPNGTWKADNLKLIEVSRMYGLSWSELGKLTVNHLREMMKRL